MQNPQQAAAPMSASRGTVRDATFALFRTLGVDTVFGNPGSTELPFLDRWPDDIRYVLGLQEASVVAMADGYARARGRPAVVNLHSAAGVGHALGNVYTAFRNRAPLVIIAGQQTRALLPNLPFLGASDATQFPQPYVKSAVEPARAEDVPAAIAHAYRVAMQRPFGPTFVSIPADDWAHPCATVEARSIAFDMAPDPEVLVRAAQRIGAARNPVFVVGAEVDEEMAGEAMVALAERVGGQVYAAPFAARICFPEDHPLFAGFLPASPAGVSEALINHDLIVVVGAGVFTYHVPGDSPLLRSGIPLLHFTSDGQAAASAPMGDSVLGSIRLALGALKDLVPQGQRASPFPRARPRPGPPGPNIPVPWLLHRLDAALPGQATLVEEAPSIRPAMQAQLTRRAWGSFFTMASGGLGYGLPAAVGLALARADKKVVCLIGDGSFMYSPQALWTAVQLGLDLTVVIVNNSGYGAMRSFSRTLQMRDVPGIDLPGLDFVRIAEGMGCQAERVVASADLDAALDRHLARRGPSLLDVVVDAEIQMLYK